MKENKYNTLYEACIHASTILNADDILNDGVDFWDIDNLMDAAIEHKNEYEDSDEMLDGIQSYYVVGCDGSIGLTDDNGYNVKWIYKLVTKQDED